MSPSRRVRRRRRQVVVVTVVVVVALVVLVVLTGGTGGGHSAQSTTTTTLPASRTPLSPDWRGSRRAVTLAFGGDVQFWGGLAQDLAADPAGALGPTVPQLLSGAQLSMVNFENALTDGTCPTPADKPYVFYTGPPSLTALSSATISLVTEANNHGLDCGTAEMAAGLSAAASAHYPVIGVGADAAAAYAPYRTTIDGQRIAVFAANDVFDPGLAGPWTATASGPGMASAVDPAALLGAVRAARRSADTIVVYLHWGTETVSCPNASQPPLARELVKAGADVVVGSNAHVPQAGGYLGTAFVDYGLGNLAFYNYAAPEAVSGTLTVTVTGRHVDGYAWRPATLVNDLPQPVTGAAAAGARASWAALRSCAGADVTAGPGRPLATVGSERGTVEHPGAHRPTTTTTH